MKFYKINLATLIILALSANIAMAEDSGICDPAMPLVFHDCDSPDADYNKAVGDALRPIALDNAKNIGTWKVISNPAFDPDNPGDFPEFIASDRTDSLRSAIENNAIDSESGDKALGVLIGQERQDRSNADIAQQGHIQTNTDNLAGEIEHRKTEDTALNGRVDDETAGRIAGDAALGVLIDDETTARETEDVAINQRAETETTERKAGDDALGVRVDGHDADIGVNTAATSKNATDIGQNAGDISDNTTDIATNKSASEAEDSALRTLIGGHEGRITTAEGTLDDITDNLLTGKIKVRNAEIATAIISNGRVGSAQFSPTGNIHINGRQTEIDGEFKVDTQVNINKMHVNINGGMAGGLTVQGNYATLMARDIPTTGMPPRNLEEGTGVFVRKDHLWLQSISKENKTQTNIVLRDDSVGMGLIEGEGDEQIISSTFTTNEEASLFYTSDGRSTTSVISAQDKRAVVQVRVDGKTYGMVVTDSATEFTGGTTTMLLDDNGVTLSNDGADAQLRGVADGTEGNHAVNYSQLQTETEARVSEDTALNGRIDGHDADIGEWKNPRTTTLRGAIENSEGVIQRNTTRITTNEGNIAANSSRIQSLDRKLSGGIATVAALGMIPDPAPGHRFSLGMGYGNFESENAVALGITGRVTNSISIKAGAGFNNDTFAAGGGVGYSW